MCVCVFIIPFLVDVDDDDDVVINEQSERNGKNEQSGAEQRVEWNEFKTKTDYENNIEEKSEAVVVVVKTSNTKQQQQQQQLTLCL